MRQRRRAFTLIELLVVIGIIMVLVALLVAGFRHLNATAARRETLAELHVLRGMTQDYENKASFTGIEANAPQVPDPSAPYPNPTQAPFPVYVDPLTVVAPGSTLQWPIVRLPANPPLPEIADTTTLTGAGAAQPPNDLADALGALSDMGDKSGAGSPRYTCGAVMRTWNVMYVLMRIPANRTVVQSIPSKRLLEATPGQTPFPISQGAVLLDGWGNPIIFVPRGGIHVYSKNPTNPGGPPNVYLVRSTGTFLLTPNGATTISKDPPMNGQERPFWASAGQDGDFTQGDDNVYSFQD